jgi:hypothetical protein
MLVVFDNGDNGFGATFCYAPGVTTKSVGVPGVWVKKARYKQIPEIGPILGDDIKETKLN